MRTENHGSHEDRQVTESSALINNVLKLFVYILPDECLNTLSIGDEGKIPGYRAPHEVFLQKIAKELFEIVYGLHLWVELTK